MKNMGLCLCTPKGSSLGGSLVTKSQMLFTFLILAKLYGSGDSGSSYGSSNSGSGYGAPSSGYNAPSSGYGAPSGGNNAPSSGYGAPSSGYNAPSGGGGGGGGGLPGKNDFYNNCITTPTPIVSTTTLTFSLTRTTP